MANSTMDPLAYEAALVRVCTQSRQLLKALRESVGEIDDPVAAADLLLQATALASRLELLLSQKHRRG